MDIGKAFAFIGEDEEWMNKLGIGAILAAIPILNFVIFGYQIQIARNVAADVERPLPEWKNLGQYFMDGLRLVAAFFVYMLPVFFMYIVFVVLMFVYADSFDPTYSSSTGSYASGDPPVMFFVLISMMMMCMMPYTFALYGLFPIMSIQIARTGSVASCFHLGEMWQLIRGQLGNYILLIIIMFGLYMGGSFIAMPFMLVAMFILCVGFLVYMFVYGALILLTMTVAGHMEGQFMKATGKPKDLGDVSDIVAFDG